MKLARPNPAEISAVVVEAAAVVVATSVAAAVVVVAVAVVEVVVVLAAIASRTDPSVSHRSLIFNFIQAGPFPRCRTMPGRT